MDSLLRTGSMTRFLIALLLASSSNFDTSAQQQIQPCDPPKVLNSLRSHIRPGSIPYDVSITPNGQLAFVHSTTAGGSRSTVFDLSTGNFVTEMSTPSFIWGYNSKSFAISDTRAVFIGSQGGNSISIKVYSISYSPLSISLLRSYTISGTALDPIGQAHDVKITPDGRRGVVVGARRILVFDLQNPTASSIWTFSGGEIASCSPLFFYTDPLGNTLGDVPINSVQVTNSRAVIQLNSRVSTCGDIPQPSVFIIDLAPTIPQLVLTDPLGPSLQVGTPCVPRWANDIAITPNGNFAVAGGSRSLALYDLTSNSRVALLSDTTTQSGHSGGLYKGFAPVTQPSPFGSNVRSLAITNNYLIAPSDLDGISVYSIGSLGMNRVQYTPFIGAHDIELNENMSRAVVRARSGIHTINLLATPAPTVTTVFTNGDPRGSLTQFTSRSVATALTSARALLIRTVPNTLSGTGSGIATIINTQTGTSPGFLASGKEFLFDDMNDRMVDVAANGNYGFIRAADSTNDLIGINICSGKSMGTFNLVGDCSGVDHMEITSNRVITVSGTGDFALVPLNLYVDIFSY